MKREREEKTSKDQGEMRMRRKRDERETCVKRERGGDMCEDRERETCVKRERVRERRERDMCEEREMKMKRDRDENEKRER